MKTFYITQLAVQAAISLICLYTNTTQSTYYLVIFWKRRQIVERVEARVLMCQRRNAEKPWSVSMTLMSNGPREERTFFIRDFHFILAFTFHISFNGLNHHTICDCDALCLLNKEKWKRLNICVINLPVAWWFTAEKRLPNDISLVNERLEIVGYGQGWGD